MKRIVWGVIALCIILIGIIGAVSADNNSSSISCENAKQITVDYLNKNTGGGVSTIDCSNLGPLFQINVTYKSQNIPVYLSNDGEYYISGAILIGDVNSPTIDGQTAGNQVINYLNNKVLSGATSTASYDSFKDLGSLYQIIVNYNGQKIPVYSTKEGAYFVQGAVDVNSNTSTNPTNNSQPPKDVPKTDKPIVEVFVFSYCPYGIQFEKALFPVYDLLKDKAYFNIVYIGAMHGEYEHIESLRQNAILNLYGKDGLFSYLKEFDTNKNIGSCNGDATCLDNYLSEIYTKLGMKKTDIQNYMNTNSEIGYQDDVAEAKQLDISGSPTFVINGVQVSVDRSPEAIKQAVCNAFTNVPSECSTKLSSKTTTPGFGGVPTSTQHCGKLIYFCSDDSPYCNMTAPVIDEYAASSGCVDVTKHILSSFMKLNQDPLALQYNVQGVPTFIFIDEETRCYSDIGGGGGTKVEDIKNKIINFKCDNNQQANNCPSYVCDGGYKPKCSIVNGQCSCESCPAKITPNESSGPIEIPPTNSSDDNGKSIISPIICQGCSLDNKCYPYGFRIDKTYCDATSTNFINQSMPNSVCNNNFECDSNLCINNKCVSGSLWDKIMRWFSRLFGGN